MAKHETPLLDQLETGPWPSFVSDIKREAESREKNEKNVEYQIPQDCCDDLLGVLELSYKHGRTHWKHGGIVGGIRLRRRRNRQILRPARDVSGSCPFSHHARVPACRQILYHQIPGRYLRPLGKARKRP